MGWLALICFLLASAGIVLILGLTPKNVSADIQALLHPQLSIKKRALTVSGRRRQSRPVRSLIHIRDALESTGRTGSFGLVCTVAFAVAAAGFALSALFGIWFILPVALSAAFILPYFAAYSAVETYDSRMRAELETALSIITAAYIRTGNIVGAVNESLPVIRRPALEIFTAFYTDATVISPDIKSCIKKLRQSVDNRVFREWCDVLLACQEDFSNCDSLMPVVSELTELRLAMNELNTVTCECRKEYFGMVLLTLGNIPLLYFLNRDWWNALVSSAAGHAVIAITGVVIIITAFFMLKYTGAAEIEKGKKEGK